MHVGDELDVERFGRELLDFFDELSRVGEEPFFGRFRRSLVANDLPQLFMLDVDAVAIPCRFQLFKRKLLDGGSRAEPRERLR